jgi:glycerol-3-phosphate dehydrogenase
VLRQRTLTRAPIGARTEEQNVADRTVKTTNDMRASVRELVSRPRAQVLVIGGGVNGIAAFRDLALQGVDVALVERGDFASGASSASSHMIHGGIRYLENGEFRLVRESVRERNDLLRTAAHYVRPLQTTIPIFSTFSGILAAPLRILTHKQGRPKERGAVLIKIGLLLYDTFSRDGGSVPRHRFRARRRSLAELGRLNPGVKYTATYFDASMHDPERLALDVLRDGVATGNARAANYVEAVGADVTGVHLLDRESGTRFTVAADVIVNASGPWTDLTNESIGMPSAYMGGTKGSHVVLDNPELLAATAGREIFFENDDGRIVLIYPLKGRVLIGTTDIDADPSTPSVCTEEEIDYFFDLVRHVFPTIRTDRDQIVYTFSGIRPLPRHDDTQPGFVSRDYRIEQHHSDELGAPVLSIVGGKWTTFRALGEHVANEVLSLLGRERSRSTRGLPIGGGRDYPSTDSQRRVWVTAHDELPAARVEALLERYGSRAAEVIGYLTEHGDVVIPDTDVSRAEVAYFVEEEDAVHLSDVVLRRTALAFTGALTSVVLEDLADAMADAGGWDAGRRATELEETRREVEQFHGMRLREGSPTA